MRNMSKNKAGKGIIFFLVMFVLVLVMIYSGLQILESTVFYDEDRTTENTTSKTITRDGIDYFPRQDITVVMVLGIDQSGPVESSNYYRNNGSADSVMLLLFDEKNEECSVLYLNRDTMLDMSVLGVRGEYAGTTYGQLALAHTYGDGLDDSCENVKDTLQKFLHGVTIDYYVSMRMDAIPILNDAVGGVTVNVVDDFSLVNPSITMGEVTLQGDQAIDFVRTRKDVGDQMNLTRMQRQKEYVNEFLKALRAKEEENINFIADVYDEVSDYIVTDCSVNTLSSMLERFADYSIKEVVSLEGENVIGEEYFEFYVDEEKLDALIIRLFYAPK
jgi:LCP family protein required for cell wall assembly